MPSKEGEGVKLKPAFSGYGHHVSEQDRAEWQRWMGARAQDAFRRGREAASAGYGEDAVFWLSRAARMARENSHVILALGMAQLTIGLWVEAFDTAARLLKRFDLREAFCIQAVAKARLGDHEAAANALGKALSICAPPMDMQVLADGLVGAVRAPGWCGASNTGNLIGAAGGLITWRFDARGALHTAKKFPLTLPNTWRTAHKLEVFCDGRPLLGSPIDLRRLREIEGLVSPARGGLEGWLWHPAEPEFVPTLRIESAEGTSELSLQEEGADADLSRPLARPRRFFLPEGTLPKGSLRLTDGYGQELSGSPIDASQCLLFDDNSEKSLPAAWRPRSVKRRHRIARTAPREPGWLVVIPAYRDLKCLRACLRSVLETSAADTEIFVVDDATPEPALARYLEKLAQSGRITLCRHEKNTGFPASANEGLRRAAGRDVVLLNSDTLVPKGWLESLCAALDQAPDIGTATPFSNDASILSYPSVTKPNPVPDRRETQKLAELCARLPTGGVIDLPTANGFCMAIRGDCLAQVGVLREDLFAQGYGEENEFCLRATNLGWRHVAAPKLFVAHIGSASFGATRTGLMRRNLSVLNALYPGYDALIQDFVRRDPVFTTRRALDLARLSQERGSRRTIIMVMHDSGGGVARVVRERSAAFHDAGYFVLMLKPDAVGCRLSVADGTFDNLLFTLPSEWSFLLASLRSLHVESLEWHHLVGHAPQIRTLHEALDVPYDVFIHDYIWFCQRVSLLGPQGRYCGEPSIQGCESCIAEVGSYLGEDISVTALLDRSNRELNEARQLMAPSNDAARRMMRHFPGLNIHVRPLEDDTAWRVAPMLPKNSPRRRIGFVGGIGNEKGYDVIYSLAEDARLRDLPLEYVLIGHSPDDDALFATGRVRITGEYREEEVADLILESKLDFGFIPSITPETWCFALGVIWRSGLKAVSFDLGAQGERIQRTGFGWTVPLGMPIQALSMLLLTI